MAAPKSASSVKFKVSAPGKVILHGEHSVVYNKLAVAASLGLRTRLELEEVDSDAISVEFLALNIKEDYNLKDMQEMLNKPLPLKDDRCDYNMSTPESICFEMMLERVKNFIKVKSTCDLFDSKQQQALESFFYLFFAIIGSVDLDLKPLKITVLTDLTLSAGTGSSASFSVLIAAALINYVKLKKCHSRNGFKQINLNGEPKIFDKFQLNLISRWGFQSEKIIHGTPSGVDNTICTYGSLVEFRKGATPKLLELNRKLNVILINTNVARDTKAQVMKVADFRQKYKTIADKILDLMDEVTVEAIECFKKINSGSGDQANFEKLAELSEVNHNLLCCLGVSHAKLDESCAILKQFGLKGKLTGAGGGGYAICLVPPYVDSGVVERAVATLNSRGFDAVYTDLGGSGVTID